ncbi:MAG: hypothetical protein Q8P45_03260 [Candidatus Harrisonbacteria bacterium]|nr:hypothetical protein [Candidatus Harrisonbacteria bacterium]
MRTFLIIYFVTVIVLLPGGGEAAIRFDFMEKPAAFDSDEAQRLLEKIDFEKLSESAKELGNKVQEKSPEIINDLEELKDKTSETADQSRQWLENEAGIDAVGIFRAIGSVFADVFGWMVSTIKKLF